MKALQRAIDLMGGTANLASAIGVGATTPQMWKVRGNVPAEYCPAIERVTKGKVRCERLRPDVAWDVLRMQAGEPEPATADQE